MIAQQRRIIWLQDPTLRLIYFTAFVFGFTSIAHENNLGATASIIAGDATTQYGIIIGLTILGIGAGYWVTAKIQVEQIMEWFIRSEILLTAVSGFSVVMALWSYTNLPLAYNAFIWAEMFVIAGLVGIEDGLILRIAERREGSLQHSVAMTYWMANLGGGLAGAAFGKLLIPNFNIFYLALFLGILDGAFVLLNTWYFRSELRRPRAMLVLNLITLIGLALTALAGDRVATTLTQSLYDDPIVEQWSGDYGLKILTCGKDSCKLFINGQIQLSTKDERQYHEPLVHPVMALANQRVHGRKINVLIAGGGDGFATRELLKYDTVGSITIIDLDPDMTGKVARSEPLVRYNGNSFADPRVRIINTDAYVWLRDKADKYFDVVIVDLVDPDTEATAKLYSLEFYKAVHNRALAKGGILVTQSTSPWFSPRAFWTVNLTLSAAFKQVVPYRWNVPSFGDWGWNMATDDAFDPQALTIDESKTEWLTSEGIHAMQFFGKTEWPIREELAKKHVVSTILQPAVTIYYNEQGAWEDWGEDN